MGPKWSLGAPWEDPWGTSDPSALNYQPLVTEATDTCLYAEDFESDCIFDVTNDGYVGTADLLLFLGSLGSLCD